MINVRRKPSAVFVLLMFSISVVAIAPRLGLSVPQAHAVTPKALINGDTVSGSPSIEEQQATALGFSVTVVSGATWDNMTQAQFAAYQVLVVGDPTCSTLALSVTSNAATWAPVVMGTAGHTPPPPPPPPAPPAPGSADPAGGLTPPPDPHRPPPRR